METLDSLKALVYPDPKKSAEYVPARIMYGGRWHTGYLTLTWDRLAIRDSGRKRHQYALVHEGNVEGVQLRRPNGRYLPVAEVITNGR